MAGTMVASVIKNDATTPPQFQNSAGTQIGTLCRAWVSFAPAATATVNASFNVSSVTYNGASDYTINFTNAFSDALYAPIVNVGTPGGNRAVSLAPYTGVSGVTASSCRVKYYDTGSGQIDPGTAYSPGSVGYAAFFR